jgi:NitT/TauT family transport system ATP-binding protein
MTQSHLLPAVDLQGVSFEYRRGSGHPLPVLSALTLSVRQGEIVSLIGPSGCGKTTILKLVAGLLEPTLGAVRVGTDPTGPRLGRCGYVPQGYSLFPWLTVKENIEYGMQFVRFSKARAADASSRLLEVTGLGAFADYYPNTLSGGMQQRVAIARALAIDPDIVLLDEPFAALDLQTRNEVQQYFLEVMQQALKAVLLVTHDIQEAVLLSDTIVILATRPSKVRKLIPVPLARPRSRELWMSEEGLAVYRTVGNEVWKDLDEMGSKSKTVNG